MPSNDVLVKWIDRHKKFLDDDIGSEEEVINQTPGPEAEESEGKEAPKKDRAEIALDRV